MFYRIVRLACAATLAVVAATTGVHAETVTYKGDVKLPPKVVGQLINPINDSGLTATDLDVPTDINSTLTNTRNLVTWRTAFGMYNDENGKPYFRRLYSRANLKIDP